MKLLLGLFLLIICCASSGYGRSRKNSKFLWKGSPAYVLPWLHRPNVCAVEEVMGSRKRYYSECMTHVPRKICGKPTFIRYHCCSGYERIDPTAKGCEGVSPIEDLMDTAKHLYLRDFRKYVKQAGVTDTLATGGAYTVFAPHNRAFKGLSSKLGKRLATKRHNKNLLFYHMVDDRYYSQDMYNNMQLETLYGKEKVKINRYSNGIVTVNCARIILPNQLATNGIMHITEKVIQPLSEQGTIMDILVKDGRFGELVTALIVTGLGDELRKGGHFTMFAPTDAAFRNAPEAVMERILNNENSETLIKLLQYHELDQSICAAAILGPTSLRTREGQKVNISCDISDRLTINGVPTIETDLVGSNGVIHVIDDLLLPESAKSLGEVLTELNLLEFLEMAEGAGMTDMLAANLKDNFTLLVPNEDAFRKMTKEQRRILTDPKAAREVFKYHVIPDKISTAQLIGYDTIETSSSVASSQVRVNVNHNKVFGINGARIVSQNHEAENGVVHVLDTVLFPPELTLMDKIEEDSGLSTFLSMLRKAGMDEILRQEGGYTVFAPTNDAFDNVKNSFLEKLMLDSQDLQQFLGYHILDAAVYTNNLEPKLHYRYRSKTHDWVELRKAGDDDPLIMNQESKVIRRDIQATNGLLNVIDSVLMCPCVESLENEVY